MKTPLLIGTSYSLWVSRRRATSSAHRPEAQRAAHRTSARSPENSPATMTPGITVPVGMAASASAEIKSIDIKIFGMD